MLFTFLSPENRKNIYNFIDKKYEIKDNFDKNIKIIITDIENYNQIKNSFENIPKLVLYKDINQIEKIEISNFITDLLDIKNIDKIDIYIKLLLKKIKQYQDLRDKEKLSKDLTLQSFFKNTKQGYITLDKDNNIIDINNISIDIMKRYFGIELKLGKNYLKSFPKKDQNEIKLKLSKAFNGENFLYERYFNNRRCYEFRYFPEFDPTKKVINTSIIITDISVRKKTERDLLESEEKFRVLSERSLVGVFIINETYFSYVNPAFSKIFGYYQNEILLTPVSQLFETKDQLIFMENIKLLKNEKKESTYCQLRGVRSDKKIIYLEVYNTLINYQGSKTIMGTVVDITKRINIERELREKTEMLKHLNSKLEDRIDIELKKRLQQEQILMQQSKLAAMGEMVGAIAHQWRQPISTLAIIIQSIKDAYDYGDLDKEYLDKTIEDSLEQIQFMSNTIDNFRNFFRVSKNKKKFEVLETILEALSLLETQLKSYFIEIFFSDTLSRSYSYGYPNEFKQVVINIINNAKDSIIEKRKKNLNSNYNGRIVITIEKSKEKISIIIKDNGVGFKNNTTNRVFEPYFTTKEQGEGVGIGLYMSKRIVQSMGGDIFATNGKNGAILTINLKKYISEGV